MQSDQNIEEPSPATIDTSEENFHTNPRQRTAAKLPAYSPANAAQRLNDIPERTFLSGVYYPVPHQLTHEPGWRTKRHIKRKNLRQTLGRIAIVERIGTRTLIPLSLIMLSCIIVGTLVFTTIAGFVSATDQKFGGKVTTLAAVLPQDSTKLYDMHGQLIYQALSQGMQTSVPLKDISPQLMHAEIAIEDQNFYSNPGYDITGIVRAAISNLTNNRVVSGGSTITQQLIKNAVVGNQETILRKLQEIILAPDISRRYSKNQILQMYLNTTYYGEQAYGAEAAAFTYYDLKATPQHTAASQLDLAQAAMLAGIPSSPIARDPLLHPEAATMRMQEVLQQMYTQGYINAQERAVAIDEAQRPDFFKRGVVNNRLAPHFVNYTLREIAKDLHVKLENLPRAGLIVNTTLDLSLQNRVLLSAQKHIAEMAKGHHMSNAAVVVIEHHTGAIRTLLGNIDPNNPSTGDFDVATEGYRQPGSSFKPYIYATAFQDGMSPGQTVLDGPLTISMCCGLPSYSPKNYDLSYHGLMTYRYALQNSFNIPAVKLLMSTGVDKALKTAQAMGITDFQGVPNYTMVLGSLSVHLIDNTAGYSTFANGGIYIAPHAVDTIKDENGKMIFNVQPVGKRALSKEAAFMITDVLSDNNSRIYEFGKCSTLVLYTHTMNQCYAGNPGTIRISASKTGTSNDFRDNWTMGYTTDYTVGVWAGNNDNSPMVNVTGVDGAGPIWHDTMMMAEEGHPLQAFPAAPDTLIKQPVTFSGKTSEDWTYKK